MSLVKRVPETATMARDKLPDVGPWRTLRQYGGWRLLREAFLRFRYGDGFSHARALGLQLALASVPLVIAVVGLSRSLGTAGLGEVVRRTALKLAPGGGAGVLDRALSPSGTSVENYDEVALWLGLAFAVASLTTAMGQVERGANRLYGVQRDRPSMAKYGRALLMSLMVGIPAMVGVTVLLAAAAFGQAVEEVYSVDDDAVLAVGLPAGAVLVAAAAAFVFRRAPRRTQPGMRWLAVGAVVSVLLWAAATGMFAAYLHLSNNFESVYGPLTGIMALLLWSELTAMALLYGLACAAQLEGARAGLLIGAPEDPEAADAG